MVLARCFHGWLCLETIETTCFSFSFLLPLSLINSVPKISKAIRTSILLFSAMFMAICPVYRDATKAVPPKSKGVRLFDFTLLCCKSQSSDVFSILNLYVHFLKFLDSPPKMRGFLCFVPPENPPNTWRVDAVREGVNAWCDTWHLC